MPNSRSEEAASPLTAGVAIGGLLGLRLNAILSMLGVRALLLAIAYIISVGYESPVMV
jgi:hypothetical protein